MLSLLCTITLIFSLCTVFASASGHADFIAAYAVNLRSGQTVGSSIVTTAPKQSTLNNGDNSGWIFGTSFTGVSYHSDFGYVRNDLMIPSQSCKKVSTSSGNGLYMRKDAGTGYAKVYSAAIPNNTFLYYISQKVGTDGDIWYKVRAFATGMDALTGYVHSDYVTTVHGI